MAPLPGPKSQRAECDGSGIRHNIQMLLQIQRRHATCFCFRHSIIAHGSAFRTATHADEPTPPRSPLQTLSYFVEYLVFPSESTRTNSSSVTGVTESRVPFLTASSPSSALSPLSVASGTVSLSAFTPFTSTRNQRGLSAGDLGSK